VSILGLGASPWSVPMAGPFRGFRARTAIPDARMVFQIVDGETWIAYIRTGLRRE
jgi:mRNA-degrading endonuclease YafQ of YafQ-DinJ toxin-antitoxin module